MTVEIVAGRSSGQSTNTFQALADDEIGCAAIVIGSNGHSRYRLTITLFDQMITNTQRRVPRAQMITLHQFEFSHFNDKARWALTWKGLEHKRISYLPGPHMPAIRRLSGQNQTPVLSLDDEVIAGSASIIDRLEQLHPEPALYPQDPQQRKAALDWQQRYDETVGLVAGGAVTVSTVKSSGPAL